MHSAPQDQIPRAFCSHNYYKSATISRSGATTTRHHSHHHQSKEAAHRRNMMRNRSSLVVCSRGPSGAYSKRASIRQNHRRSLRYTRTLDIILEETQQQPQSSGASEDQSFSSPSCSEHEDRPSCDSPTTTVMATDYWHSMRSLKKSATTVSLDSLLVDEENNEHHRPMNTSSSSSFSCSNFDSEEDYDNFLDDWDL
eukprot:jgi/Psemu1/6943/gm1.6943_g